MNAGILSSNVFCFYYYGDKKHSDVEFGKISDKYYQEGTKHEHKVKTRAHWNINVVDVKVCGESVRPEKNNEKDSEPAPICEKGCQGLVDTGTSFNTFETKQYKLVMKMYKKCKEDNPGEATITYVLIREHIYLKLYKCDTLKGYKRVFSSKFLVKPQKIKLICSPTYILDDIDGNNIEYPLDEEDLTIEVDDENTGVKTQETTIMPLDVCFYISDNYIYSFYRYSERTTIQL
jgi:hypothetical protein